MKLLYSTYFEWNLMTPDGMPGIAVDGADNAYVTGTTQASDFPTTISADQPKHPGKLGTEDAFFSKLAFN